MRNQVRKCVECVGGGKRDDSSGIADGIADDVQVSWRCTPCPLQGVGLPGVASSQLVLSQAPDQEVSTCAEVQFQTYAMNGYAS